MIDFSKDFKLVLMLIVAAVTLIFILLDIIIRFISWAWALSGLVMNKVIEIIEKH